MGRIFFSVEEYSSALDITLAETLIDPEGAVQTNVKKAINLEMFILTRIIRVETYTP